MLVFSMRDERKHHRRQRVMSLAFEGLVDHFVDQSDFKLKTDREQFCSFLRGATRAATGHLTSYVNNRRAS